MATQSSNPFTGYTVSSAGTGSVVPDGAAQRMAIDNLLRRELRISDPGDAQQIAQEAQGLPFLTTAPPPMLPAATEGSSTAELQQAKDDVERDLKELTTNSLLKDITPELEGWGRAIRSAIAEGTMAARFALDPRQRDKAFAVRRQLGDYARMARLVGALTPTMSLTYRKLAQSLDEVGAVLLVMMGEALASVGFSGGRFLLQVPFSELQVRRDATIYALRNLIGATQQAFAPNEWPRGLDAYRRLFDLLEHQGQGDLRALLVEVELARTMDELIQRAAHGRAEGMRALGATAQLDLERFRRLVIIGQRVVVPESPPLTSFLEALRLFSDAFEPSGGFRLLRIARPAILFYGLYGVSGSERPDDTLLRLIIARGTLASLLDCFLQCGCTPEAVACQIALDKILYDTDRAIDLYAVGSRFFGEPERRAAAYSYVVDAFLALTDDRSSLLYRCIPLQEQRILPILRELQDQLRPPLFDAGADVNRVIADIVGWAGRVVTALTLRGRCTQEGTDPDLCAQIQGQIDILNLTGSASRTLGTLTRLLVLVTQGLDRLNLGQAEAERERLARPESLRPFFGLLEQELCIQRDLEIRWETLVRTMAPDCVGLDRIFTLITGLIDNALALVSGRCEEFDVILPPHYETSLDAIANDVNAAGVGRVTGF
jgi:hypothetical protein